MLSHLPELPSRHAWHAVLWRSPLYCGFTLSSVADICVCMCAPCVRAARGKVHVHTLLDALNDMAAVPERKTDVPLRLPISGE